MLFNNDGYHYVDAKVKGYDRVRIRGYRDITKRVKAYEIDNLNELLKDFNNHEIIDSRDGCLEDNFVVVGPKTTMFVYEHFLNEWESNQIVTIVSNHYKKILQEQWAQWEDFTDAYDLEYEEVEV